MQTDKSILSNNNNDNSSDTPTFFDIKLQQINSLADNLTHLTLEESIELTASQIVTLLQVALKVTQNIDEFHINYFTQADQYLGLIIEIINQNRSLKVLNIGGIQLSMQSWIDLLDAIKHCPHLDILLLNNLQLNSTHMIALCGLVEAKAFENINLGGNQIDSVGINELVKSLQKGPCQTSLKSLALSGNPLGDSGVRHILDWLMPQDKTATIKIPALETLYLKNAGMSYDNAVMLVKLLTNEDCRLINVALEDNNFIDKNDQDYEISINKLYDFFMQIIINNKLLKQLSLDLSAYECASVKSILNNKKYTERKITANGKSIVNPNYRPAAFRLKRDAENKLLDYKEKAEFAEEEGNYTQALGYYKDCLILDPYDITILHALDRVWIADLLQECSIIKNKLDSSDISSTEAQQFYQKIKIALLVLDKKWQTYHTQKNEDEDTPATLLNEYKHLQALTVSLQKAIQASIPFNTETAFVHPLLQAVIQGDKKTIDKWLKYNYDINLPDLEKNTPIHYAAKLGNKDIINYLFDNGAKANFFNKDNQTIAMLLPNNSSRDLQKLARELHFKSSQEVIEKKAIQLLENLSQPSKRLNIEDAKRLRKFFEGMQATLKELNYHYQASLERVKSDTKLYDDITRLYDSYSDAYEPLLVDPSQQPNCYKLSKEKLNAEASTIENYLKKNSQVNSEKQKSVNGFYNSIARIAIDILVLQNLIQADLLAGHDFYLRYFMTADSLENEEPPTLEYVETVSTLANVEDSVIQTAVANEAISNNNNVTMDKSEMIPTKNNTEEYNDYFFHSINLLANKAITNNFTVEEADYASNWEDYIKERIEELNSDNLITSSQEEQNSFLTFYDWLYSKYIEADNNSLLMFKSEQIMKAHSTLVASQGSKLNLILEPVAKIDVLNEEQNIAVDFLNYYLASAHQGRLSDLIVRNFPITSVTLPLLCDIISKNKFLKKIMIQGCDLKDTAAISLSKSMTELACLGELHLPDNKLSEQGVVYILQALKQRINLFSLFKKSKAELKILALGGNSINHVLLIFQALPANLEQLFLSKNPLEGGSLAKGLESTPAKKLNWLMLNAVTLSKSHIEDLATALINHQPQLKQLALLDNHLDQFYIHAIARLLKAHPSLVKLDYLTNNNFNLNDILSFAKIIQSLPPSKQVLQNDARQELVKYLKNQLLVPIEKAFGEDNYDVAKQLIVSATDYLYIIIPVMNQLNSLLDKINFYSVQVNNDISDKDNNIPTRYEPSRAAVVNGKYELVNRVSREEALHISAQHGIQVSFNNDKESKVAVILGAGHFGKLRLARILQSGKYIAVKKIKNTSENDEAIQSSKEEGLLQFELSNEPNIMRLYDSIEIPATDNRAGKGDILYQFMPLANFGNGKTLMQYLSSLPFDAGKESFLNYIAKQLLIGLAAMHNKKIYHLDIKPDNFVLDREGNVYWIDFGCAMKANNVMGSITGGEGDLKFYSPERLAHRQYVLGQAPVNAIPVTEFIGSQADAWALGVTLLMLWLGRYPFWDYKNRLSLEEINKWDANYFLTILDNLSDFQIADADNYLGLVKGLLEVNPNNRLTIEAASKWFSLKRGEKWQLLKDRQKFLEDLETLKTSSSLSTNTSVQRPAVNDDPYASTPDFEAAYYKGSSSTVDSEYSSSEQTQAIADTQSTVSMSEKLDEQMIEERNTLRAKRKKSYRSILHHFAEQQENNATLIHGVLEKIRLHYGGGQKAYQLYYDTSNEKMTSWINQLDELLKVAGFVQENADIADHCIIIYTGDPLVKNIDAYISAKIIESLPKYKTRVWLWDKDISAVYQDIFHTLLCIKPDGIQPSKMNEKEFYAGTLNLVRSLYQISENDETFDQICQTFIIPKTNLKKQTPANFPFWEINSENYFNKLVSRFNQENYVFSLEKVEVKLQNDWQLIIKAPPNVLLKDFDDFKNQLKQYINSSINNNNFVLQDNSIDHQWTLYFKEQKFYEAVTQLILDVGLQIEYSNNTGYYMNI